LRFPLDPAAGEKPRFRSPGPAGRCCPQRAPAGRSGPQSGADGCRSPGRSTEQLACRRQPDACAGALRTLALEQRQPAGRRQPRHQRAHARRGRALAGGAGLCAGRPPVAAARGIRRARLWPRQRQPETGPQRTPDPMNQPTTPLKAALLVLAGAIMLSFAAIFARLTGMPPTTSGFYRMVFGTLAFAGLLALRPEMRVGWRDNWAGSFVIGAFFAADIWFWHRAI